MVWNFLLFEKKNFRCKLFENETFELEKNISSILSAQNATYTNHFLSKDSNYNSKCYVKSLARNVENNLTDLEFKKCDSWVYSNKYYDKTLVTEV